MSETKTCLSILSVLAPPKLMADGPGNCHILDELEFDMLFEILILSKVSLSDQRTIIHALRSVV